MMKDPLDGSATTCCCCCCWGVVVFLAVGRACCWWWTGWTICWFWLFCCCEFLSAVNRDIDDDFWDTTGEVSDLIYGGSRDFQLDSSVEYHKHRQSQVSVEQFFCLQLLWLLHRRRTFVYSASVQFKLCMLCKGRNETNVPLIYLHPKNLRLRQIFISSRIFFFFSVFRLDSFSGKRALDEHIVSWLVV